MSYSEGDVRDWCIRTNGILKMQIDQLTNYVSITTAQGVGGGIYRKHFESESLWSDVMKLIGTLEHPKALSLSVPEAKEAPAGPEPMKTGALKALEVLKNELMNGIVHSVGIIERALAQEAEKLERLALEKRALEKKLIAVTQERDEAQKALRVAATAFGQAQPSSELCEQIREVAFAEAREKFEGKISASDLLQIENAATGRYKAQIENTIQSKPKWSSEELLEELGWR